MIQIKNINFSYSKNNTLINNLSLNVELGKIYGLFGKNGTGKTTLLKLMSGLLFPKAGECSIDNEKLSDRLPSTLKELFIVPEEFSLPPIKMSSYVNINAPFYPNFGYEKYAELRLQFELPEDKKLDTLSFGQKKKFLLAFALATNVKTLLLDEPTNGLDIPSKSQLRKAIASSVDENTSIVISTHQARDLENLIDTILILEDGEIILNGDYGKISENYSFEKVRTLDDVSDILYSEETLGGYKIIRESKNSDTLLDLELLFNAVVSGNKLQLT
jgi:ABC-2 type transport system ATP-binding protein